MRPDRNALFEHAWELMTLEQKAALEEEAAAYFESVKVETTRFFLGLLLVHEDEFLYKKRFSPGQRVTFRTRDYIVTGEVRESGHDHTTVTVEMREAHSGDADS